MGCSRFILTAFVTALMAFVVCLPCQAYYDDTHYSLNYYLARLCGFTVRQSHRMASAARVVDYCGTTEPCQYGQEAANLVPGTEFKREIQTPRSRFHAFLNELQYPGVMTKAATDLGKAEALIVDQRNFLFDLAVNPNQGSAGNLGVFLHYYQDEFAHKGYGTKNGHWFAPEALAKGLPLGSYCDWLCSYDSDRHLDMMRKTVAYMNKFMRASSKGQSKGLGGQAPSQQDLTQVLAELRSVNVQERPTNTLSMPNVLIREPDYEKSFKVIDRLLAERGFKDTIPRNGVNYEFDTTGRVRTEQFDRWVMWGDLHIKFSSPTTVAPVQIVCQAYKDGPIPSYEIERSETLPIGAREVSFTKIPVGPLNIKAMCQGRVIASKRIVVEKAVQEEELGFPQLELLVAQVSPSTIKVGESATVDIQYRMNNIPRESEMTVQEAIVITTPTGSKQAYRKDCIHSYNNGIRKISQIYDSNNPATVKFTYVLGTSFGAKKGEMYLRVLGQPLKQLAQPIEGLWNVGQHGMGGQIRIKRSAKGYVGLVTKEAGLGGGKVGEVAFQLTPIDANKLVGRYKRVETLLDAYGRLPAPVWEDWIFEITAPNTMLGRRGRGNMLLTRIGD